jgi:hypothetical protein
LLPQIQKNKILFGKFWWICKNCVAIRHSFEVILLQIRNLHLKNPSLILPNDLLQVVIRLMDRYKTILIIVAFWGY